VDSVSKQIYDLVLQKDLDNPLSYVQQIVQPLCIEKLNEMIMDCKDCSQCNTVKSLVAGNPNATVMMIGDYLSPEQAISVEGNYTTPFMDEGGKVLSKALSHLEVNESELFYMNVINCWPYRKMNDSYVTRPPTKEETANCKPFVNYAINVVKPRFIILFGNVALNRFKKGVLNNVRGEIFDINGTPALATYHPFDLVDDGQTEEELLDMKRELFIEDLRKAFDHVLESNPSTNVYKGGN
jgi:uracil-DNA glycosylase family 4